MRSLCLAAALLAAFFTPAQAHDGAKHGAGSAAASAVAPVARPARNPQAYFTDRELLTQDGRKVRFYSDLLKGRTVVINTIYTTCKDACPLITAQLVAVRNKLAAGFGKDIVFVSVTSDPENDTPQALKKFAAKLGADVPGWTFLTGAKGDVDHILKKLGQWSENIEGHSTQLVVWNFNADRGRKMLPNLPPELIAAQIGLVADGDSNVPLPMLGPARAN